MVAAVESMSFFGAVPWHGLGTPIKESQRYSITEGIKVSGLDWDVELKPLFLEDGTPVDEFQQAVIRASDKKILGTVGPRYNPLQNSEAFDWFQPLFDSKMCALHTAGSLFDGQKVWILAEIMGTKPLEIAKNDLVSKFLLLSNSHDGTTAVRVGFTPVRVVCANTLAMAHNSAGSKLLRLRHQKSLQENLEKVRDIISLANKEFEATAEQYRFLASKRIVNADDLHKYVKIMAGVELETKEEDISTRSKNIMNELLQKMVSGRGNDNPAIKGTWWAALNGVTEYLNWDRGRTTDTRLNSIWFTDGVERNNKALKFALEYANAA